MFVFLIHSECEGAIYAGHFNSDDVLESAMDGFRGRPCPACGKPVVRIVLGVPEGTTAEEQGTGETWNQPPRPRAEQSWLHTLRRSHARRARRYLAAKGGSNDGMVGSTARAVLNMVAPEWKRPLALIPVGVLDTYEPNAVCILFKGCTVPVILFHRGLGQFVFYMNGAVVGANHFGSFGNPQVAVQSDKTVRWSAEAALHAALIFAGVEKTGEYKEPVDHAAELSPMHRLVCMWCTQAITEFLLAHEFAHAVLGHQTRLQQVFRDEAGADLMQYSRAFELEADQWAQDLLYGAYRPEVVFRPPDFSSADAARPRGVVVAGPLLAFLYFEFLDYVMDHPRSAGHGLLMSGSTMGLKDGSSHPPHHERFRALESYAVQHADPTCTSLVMAVQRGLGAISKHFGWEVSKEYPLLHHAATTDWDAIAGGSVLAAFNKSQPAYEHQGQGRRDTGWPTADPDDAVDDAFGRAEKLREYGCNSAAARAHERELGDRRRRLGASHPDTLASRFALAEVHRSAKDLLRARRLHEEVLASRRKSLGWDHNETLRSRFALAEVSRDQGDLVKASKSHVEVLQARLGSLGQDHPETLQSRFALADLAAAQGRIAEATRLHSEIYDTRRQILGPKHKDTLWSATYLAVLLDSSDPIAAHELRETVYAVCAKTLAREHPLRAVAAHNLLRSPKFPGSPLLEALMRDLAWLLEADDRDLPPDLRMIRDWMEELRASS